MIWYKKNMFSNNLLWWNSKCNFCNWSEVSQENNEYWRFLLNQPQPQLLLQNYLYRGFNPNTRSFQACLKDIFYIMFRPEVNFIVHADTGRNYYFKILEYINISFWYRTVDLLAMLKLYFCYSVIADECEVLLIWNKFVQLNLFIKCDLWTSFVIK